MDDITCQENIKGAEAMINSGKIPDVYFWKGYLVGMKSHYHNNPEEHAMYLQYFECKDLSLHSKSLGYRIGYSGASLAAAKLLAEGLEEKYEKYFEAESKINKKSVNTKSSNQSRELWDWVHIVAGFMATVGGPVTAIWLAYITLTVSHGWHRWAVLFILLFIFRLGVAPLFIVSACTIHFYYNAAGIWLPISSIIIGGMTLYDKFIREKRDRLIS